MESEGLATIVLGLIPQHVRVMRPPRALLVPFELGRPLGAPHNAELQRDVLTTALSLLDHSGPGPVAQIYDSDVGADAGDDQPWVCPVSFPAPPTGNSLADCIAEEVRLLRPWFDLAYRQRGHTGSNASGTDIEALVVWLCMFESAAATLVDGRPLADSFKLAVEDLKAFYLEAVTAQPSSSTSSDLSKWFWEQTAAGELLWSLRKALREHPDEGVRLHAQFTLVPKSVVARRE